MYLIPEPELSPQRHRASVLRPHLQVKSSEDKQHICGTSVTLSPQSAKGTLSSPSQTVSKCMLTMMLGLLSPLIGMSYRSHYTFNSSKNTSGCDEASPSFVWAKPIPAGAALQKPHNLEPPSHDLLLN